MDATGESGPVDSVNSASAELARITLPAGSYMVSFDSVPYTTSANASNQDVACYISRDATVLADAYGQTIAGQGNGNVDFVGLVNFPAAADLVVSCFSAVSTSWYRNRLTAIKVGTATGGIGRPETACGPREGPRRADRLPCPRFSAPPAHAEGRCRSLAQIAQSR